MLSCVARLWVLSWRHVRDHLDSLLRIASFVCHRTSPYVFFLGLEESATIVTSNTFKSKF